MRFRSGMLAALLLLCAAGPPPAHFAALRRGINITGWFRFADGQGGPALSTYMSDRSLTALVEAGFTFVRLPFDPDFAVREDRRAILLAQISRVERAGLAVVLVPASATWQLENREQDREALRTAWRALAPALKSLNAARTFPEILNEPVFTMHPDRWDTLQGELANIIRGALADSTIIATGADWSSAAGLEALTPLPDQNIVYTFHFYDPSELTSLAAYRPNVDRAALGGLPFPAQDPAACIRATSTEDADTAALIRFVCASQWTEASIVGRIARVEAWAKRNGASIVVGEFGATARLNPSARLHWIETVRTASERAGMRWALWGYDDIMGFNLPRPPPRAPHLDSALLAALGRRIPAETK